MAHDLLHFDDGSDAMFYVDETPWHGLGERLNNPPTAAEAIRAAQQDWEVAKTPLFHSPDTEASNPLLNRYALMPGARWPNRERPLFGIVTAEYEILQNKDAFSFFDPLVKSGYATYETAGALGKGERIWVLAKLRDDLEVWRGDLVKRYLLLSNRHDGHGAVQVLFTPIRVVCQNTLTMALRSAEETLGIRHDARLFRRLDAAADEMRERIEAQYAEIARHFRQMLDRSLEEVSLSAYLAATFPDPPPPDDARKADDWRRHRNAAFWSRRASEMLYRKGPHSRIAGRNLWAAYNAVTAFVDHARPPKSRGRRPAAQLDRIWFGDGHQIKVRAFEIAVRMLMN